jgi:hypothetical protein
MSHRALLPLVGEGREGVTELRKAPPSRSATGSLHRALRDGNPARIDLPHKGGGVSRNVEPCKLRSKQIGLISFSQSHPAAARRNRSLIASPSP